MERINFREPRDLGGILDVAARFLKQNFVKMVKTTFPIFLVPLALGGVLSGVASSEVWGGLDTSVPQTDPFAMFGPAYFGGLFFIMIGYLLFYSSTNAYIKLYQDGEEEIGMKDVLGVVGKTFLGYFFGAILFVVVTYIGIFVCLFPGIYLSVVLIPMFMIMTAEGTGVFASWSRAFRLIKGHWWQTFGLYIVTGLIYFGLMVVSVIPMYAFVFADVFTTVSQNPGDPEVLAESMGGITQILTYLSPLYYLLMACISLVYVVVVAAKYYSLAEELDGTSDIEKIEDIGTA